MAEENLIEKYIRTNNFGRVVGMEFKVITPGTVEYSVTVTKDHLATPTTAHGGMISALVDGALGTAALSLVAHEYRAVSTVEYKINYLSPSFLNDQLVAKAKVDHAGKRIIISSCEVYCINRDNKLIAKAMGTFNAYDAKKGGY